MNRTGGIAITTLMLLASLASAQSATRKATSVIIGSVSDTGLRPIPGANVNFAGSSVHATTDSLGRFQVVNVPSGKFILIVRNIGFAPAAEQIDVAEADTLRLAFTLERATQELPVMLVTERTLSAKLREFEARRRAGFGTFFTHADIDRINPVTVGDVLRRATSVRMRGESAFSAREFAPCPMAVFLDGVPLGPGSLAYIPSPKEIAAIEVYAGAATVPVWLPKGPLGTRLGCGAILIWTNDGSISKL